MSQTGKEILDTMLGYLGFAFEIKEIEAGAGLTLQVYTSEKEKLIGHEGEVLEDLQFMVNRLLQIQDPNAPKVQVDVEHYRDMRNDTLVQHVQKFAEMVRQTGRPFHLDPMNAYDRRLVHHAFKDDPDVMTWSPPDDARVKRITLQKRTSAPSA
ncbi:MAG: R3H domain-containing nucleic acid-binding protein [Verrucomicrobiota bacterium]